MKNTKDNLYELMKPSALVEDLKSYKMSMNKKIYLTTFLLSHLEKDFEGEPISIKNLICIVEGFHQDDWIMVSKQYWGAKPVFPGSYPRKSVIISIDIIKVVNQNEANYTSMTCRESEITDNAVYLGGIRMNCEEND